MENGKNVKEIKILVNWPTQPRDFSLIQLTYTPDATLPYKNMDLKKNPMIESSESTLEFIGENKAGGIAFELTDKTSGKKETLDFNLGWWLSWINYSAWNGG